jgi:hypothetical protein
MVSEGRQDGDKVLGDIVIHDPAAMGSNRQLSLGYRLDVEASPGVTPEGEKYDYIQRNIVINHLSVVPAARAGGEARLNLDGDEIYENESEVKNIMKHRLDGIEYEAAPEIINALDKATKRADEAETAGKDTQKRLDSVTAERDTLRVKVDAHPVELEKVRKDAADSINAAVKTRVDLLQIAGTFRIDKADELTDKDIKLAVIKAVHGDGFDPAGKSDDYINAAFDLAKAEKRTDSMAEQRKKLYSTSKRADAEEDSAEGRRQKMIERAKNAYKGDEKGGK